ncbi:Fic family protein [Mycolicibacterium sp. 050232]|uniref:Fic family protein n=1 Tax=Mycolicibacterium sp. 050232 TaxID=3113982 RepID=UPI002E2A0B8F|nr:Fic family protein [Mycolicibacterium sp. 050232]MED5811957.1 Fic family protein [Mycolicibacterium sp. 050232]
MSYRTLKSIFHQRDAAGADAEERARRGSPSAMTWDFRLGGHQMFCMTTPRMSVLTERVMMLDARAQSAWASLPLIAQSHYLHSMIVEEIQATNDIENVRSTRREIADALRSLHDGSTQKRRFREMVRLYEALGDRTVSPPETLDDIRALYDAVTAGEVTPGDEPDGTRFRAGTVSITSGQKVVHVGMTPESAIDDALTVMLTQRRDEDVPRLIRAAVAHLIFEVAHPFYDGNGRTGRYLMALDIGDLLSPISWFSLSATIFDNRDSYYRAFTEVEHPLNRGDATSFVEVMLGIFSVALHRLATDLDDRREALSVLHQRIHDIGRHVDAPADIDDDGRAILFLLGQAALFGLRGVLTLNELADSGTRSKQFVRSRVQIFVDAGLVDVVSRKPLRFQLSSAGRVVCGVAAAPSTG